VRARFNGDILGTRPNACKHNLHQNALPYADYKVEVAIGQNGVPNTCTWVFELPEALYKAG